MALTESAPADQRETCLKLIDNAAFMAVELEDLQEQIRREGTTDKYQNGAAQYGQKISAAMQAYNTMVKNYNTTIKTLLSIVPAKGRKSESLAETMSKLLGDDDLR